MGVIHNKKTLLSPALVREAEQALVTVLSLVIEREKVERESRERERTRKRENSLHSESEHGGAPPLLFPRQPSLQFSDEA